MGKFREYLRECELNEAMTMYKISKESFNSKEFQDWLDKSMGEQKTEGNITIYHNKAGVPVFAYDKGRESLNIMQKGLTIEQLKSYGIK